MDPRAYAVIGFLALGSACTGASAPGPSPGEVYDLSEAHARGLEAVEEPALFDAPAVLLTGAKVMTAEGQVFDPGYILLRGGRIEALGEGPGPDLPEVHSLALPGHIITPGIIDAHSHLGVYSGPSAEAHSDGNEATSPLTPGVWAEHSVWPQDPGFERAIAGGVTTLQALPGSANLTGGRGVTLHLVPQRGSRAMRFPGAPETVKLACGENPKRVYGERSQGPSTRMGNLHALREGFLAAEAYQAQWAAYEAALEGGKEGGKPPPSRDLDLETLVGIMEGNILPQIHCYRSDDMLSMMQVSHEFGFQIQAFHHALEAYKIRDILTEEGIAIATWADWWGFKMEAYDTIPENAALMTETGGIAHIHSDSSIGIQRLNQEAGKAYHAGLRRGIELTEDDALRWITYNPAWILGIEGEVGSLEVGKRADVVVWASESGTPFSNYARARYVFIDGALRYSRDAHYDPSDSGLLNPSRPAPWSDYLLGQEATQ